MTPTWTDILQALGSILGIAVMLVGFVFIYIQIKQINKSIISNTNNYVYTQLNEFLNFIIANSIRPYFYENKFYYEDAKREEVYAACEMASYTFEFVFLEKENYKKGIWIKWLNYMAFIYKNSPIIREYLEQKKDWYLDDMIDYFNTINVKNTENE